MMQQGSMSIHTQSQAEESSYYHKLKVLQKIIQIMIAQTQQTTAIEEKMKREVRSIYDALIKCGFPGMINKSIPKDEKEMSELLSEYFQPTPNRQLLIQWLIVQLYPLYQQQSIKSDKKSAKTKKLISYLWRLGVMPYSKHTKNLDYQKYVEGLLGYENSINLLFNLCTLISQSKRQQKSRKDGQFHYFLEDVIKNYDSLINVQYDPYKISFPTAYHQLSEEEFQEKYEDFLGKIKQLTKENQTKKEEIRSNEASFERIFMQFQSNKAIFLKTYDTFTQKMKKAIDDHQSLLQNWNKQQNNQFQGRTICVSAQLPSLYRQYKQKIKMNTLLPSNIGQNSQQIMKMIISLNANVQL